MKMLIKKLRPNAIIPSYQSEGAAGFDLHACFEEEDTVYLIGVKEQVIIKTGLSVAVPYGFELQIRPRSGLSAKHMITVTNSPGTIDSDYRGEIMVILCNLGDDSFLVSEGDRIAQGVLSPIVIADFEETDTLDETKRGAGGLGHTGT